MDWDIHEDIQRGRRELRRFDPYPHHQPKAPFEIKQFLLGTRSASRGEAHTYSREALYQIIRAISMLAAATKFFIPLLITSRNQGIVDSRGGIFCDREDFLSLVIVQSVPHFRNGMTERGASVLH
jgi:hypothetical protein